VSNDSKLFFISVDPIHTGVSTVTVIRSEKKRVYGRSRHTIKTIWDNSWNALRPQVPEDFHLIAETGGHQSFPRDSARFDFDLEAIRKVNLTVKSYQRRRFRHPTEQQGC